MVALAVIYSIHAHAGVAVPWSALPRGSLPDANGSRHTPLHLLRTTRKTWLKSACPTRLNPRLSINLVEYTPNSLVVVRASSAVSDIATPILVTTLMVKQPQRAALYLRVSADGQTTENRRPKLTAVAPQRCWTALAAYDDNSISSAETRDQA
jgi:hypothetical protein